MKAYKLTLAFEDLNQLIDFYKIGLKKPLQKAMDTITSMGMKGLLTPNPDKSITMTWYFRTLPKYNKIADAYIKCMIKPSAYIPTTIKLDYDGDN